MKQFAASSVLTACILVLYLLVAAGGFIWTFSVEASGMSADSDYTDAAVTFRNLELPYSFLTISIYPWKNEMTVPKDLTDPENAAGMTSKTDGTGQTAVPEQDNFRFCTLPEIEFLLLSADDLTPSAGDIDFSGFLSLYSTPGKNLLYKDLCGESFKLSSADSLDETGILVPLRFGGWGEHGGSFWENYSGCLYAGSRNQHAGFELLREFKHGACGWSLDVSHIDAEFCSAGEQSGGAPDQLAYEYCTEAPYILYHSAWIFASVPSLRFLFGTGRRESPADAGEQWFVMAAGITESNITIDGGIYIAPRGLTDYDNRRHSVLCASEAELSADLHEFCTWKFDWAYALQSPMPWNTLHTLPGRIDWGTEIAFSVCNTEKAENELHMRYSGEYEASYDSFSKESLDINKGRMLTLRLTRRETNCADSSNSSNSSSDARGKSDSSDACSLSAKSTAVFSDAVTYFDEQHRSRRFPGIEEFRQSVSLKKVFPYSGITSRVSLKYVYDCLGRTMDSASSAFEISKNFSWGTLTAKLEDLDSIELSCSISCSSEEL